MVTANASGFFSNQSGARSIRISETYPISWSNLSTGPSANKAKAFPLTLSSWYGSYPDQSKTFKINNLGGVPPWLLTQASLYNEYRFLRDPVLHWIPAGGTSQTGQIAFGLLRDPNDLFRGAFPKNAETYVPLRTNRGTEITAEDVLTMEHSYAGPISLPFSHPFPLERDRRLRTWMRQDSELSAFQASVRSTDDLLVQPSANIRLDSPFGAICVYCSEDIFSGSTLGRLLIEYDVEFRSRVIPSLQSPQVPSNGTLSVQGIPDEDLLRGKTYIGVHESDGKQVAYRKTQGTVDPIRSVKLVASNHMHVLLDLDRIMGQIPEILIESDSRLLVIPHECSLSLPTEKELTGRFTYSAALIPYSNQCYLELMSEEPWSGILSWNVS
jgi:hypothetical protein